MPKIVKDEDIYRAVIEIISRYGYANATTKHIAETANISEVTIFRKFDSKQNLVKKAISSVINQSELSNASQYTGDIISDFHRLLKAYQDTAVMHGDFVFALFQEMAYHPELVDAIDEPMNIFLDIGKLINRYQEEGKLRKENPLHTLAVLFGPVMYTTMMRKALPIKNVPPLNLSEYLALFLAGRENKNQES